MLDENHYTTNLLETIVDIDSSDSVMISFLYSFALNEAFKRKWNIYAKKTSVFLKKIDSF